MLLSRDFIRMSFLFAIFIKKTKCPRSFLSKKAIYINGSLITVVKKQNSGLGIIKWVRGKLPFSAK